MFETSPASRSHLETRDLRLEDTIESNMCPFLREDETGRLLKPPIWTDPFVPTSAVSCDKPFPLVSIVPNLEISLPSVKSEVPLDRPLQTRSSNHDDRRHVASSRRDVWRLMRLPASPVNACRKKNVVD